jgi:hypothetical protein
VLIPDDIGTGGQQKNHVLYPDLFEGGAIHPRHPRRGITDKNSSRLRTPNDDKMKQTLLQHVGDAREVDRQEILE